MKHFVQLLVGTVQKKKMNTKSILLLFSSVIFLNIRSFAQIVLPPPPPKEVKPIAKDIVDSKKLSLIKTILTQTRIIEQKKEAFEKYIEYNLKYQNESFPKGYWEEVKKSINTDTLENDLIIVYSKHYTTLELKKLIKFYKTNFGKKVMEVTPILNTEVNSYSGVWQSNLMYRIYGKMKNN